MTREQRAQIARENGAKSKGPATPEGKQKSARNAITHGRRATALKLLVPPHSACLANEERQAFYTLFDQLTAKFRPSDDAELALVREIADFQWKMTRNRQIENAIFNRELLRQAQHITGSLPELRDLEISIAAHEALTGNKTVAELRKDTQACIRAIAALQRRLIQMQRNFAPAAEVPPSIEPDRLANQIVERTEAGTTQPVENTRQAYDVKGPITENVRRLYTEIFKDPTLELIGREPLPDPKAA